MKTLNTKRQRISMLVSTAIIVMMATMAQAQNHPRLFRQQPATTQPGRNGVAAHIGDIDEAVLSAAPAGLTIAVPGRADLSFQQHSHERRGGQNLVWRGKIAGDRNSTTTLTIHSGMVFGRIERGNEVFSVRPGENGKTIVERLDTNSFAPEWGHDHATHGHDHVPPISASTSAPLAPTTSTTAAAATAGTVEIVLMSVYTPQARAAAGGTTQIQGQIQAAVDQANTAFINSNMIARFYLGHAEEVAYNDSGNISNDLNWVTGDATVASLRNTHGADMVSLIVENGGGYCGVGWVQRNPGSGFSSYAFQVTDLSCFGNGTLAHEHGHNMGMEHNPENSSVGPTPSSASYPYSFGHWVSGQFATIMTYNSICPAYCPRVLNFSNPDVLYNGFATGLPNQRDNAQTGDNTAPIIAAFRSGGGSATNSPPTFTADPMTRPNATVGLAYASTIAGSATDSNNDPLTFAKSAGPAWLNVASDGTLSGVAGSTGLQSFTVSVSDGKGGVDTAILQISVVAAVPINTPPVFSSNPIGKPDGAIGVLYTNTIAGSATDANGDPITYAKVSGPTWLTVSTAGSLRGTPPATSLGLNQFTVRASDGRGNTTTATLNLTILNTMPAPSNLVATSTVTKQINLSWADNSNGESGFRIERSLNGTTFSAIANVRAGVTSYSNKYLLSGRNYIYRVRAYYGTRVSAYSNTASAIAQ